MESFTVLFMVHLQLEFTQVTLLEEQFPGYWQAQSSSISTGVSLFGFLPCFVY